MKSTLYFDGQCSICSKEVRLLRQLKNSHLELVDLWQTDIDVPHEDLQRILHLRAPDGHWKKGLDANVAAWQSTAIGFLWSPLLWPVIAPIANTIYSRWANHRYQKKQDTKNNT